MRFLRSGRGLVLTAAVLLVGLCLVRPGVQSMRQSIVRSISSALGRPVDTAWVSLRFLPQPGFELKQFIVHDDPHFSAEPVLQAAEVTAVLRIGPLLRGKLEIARLSFKEPSLNLVRNKEGKWNVSSLLERTSQSAPAAGSAARRTFPYIDADNARVNFKIGQEKKPFALVNADFSLWQDSELTWGMRLKAQPVRADFNLSDTGTIKIEGSWQPAAELRKIPLKFQAAWVDAQLGQGTKLLWSEDKGWRGGVRLNATLSGTPEDLAIEAQASVDDFRRYDIATGSPIRLATKCATHYRLSSRTFSAMTCRTPVGDGQVILNGSFSMAEPSYDLTLSAQSVPLQAFANVALHAKRNLPQDLAASGNVEADLRFTKAGGGDAIWTGGGQVINVQLASKLTQARLYVDAVPFSLVSEAPIPKKRTRDQLTAASRHLELGPISLELPKAGLTSVKGTVDRSGYSFDVQGETDIPHLLRAARTTGLNAPPVTAEGKVSADLNLAGTWAGFAAPVLTGKLQLHAVRAQVRGLKRPLELSSATVVLDQQEARALNVTGQLGGSLWQGSVSVPRRCNPGQVCPIHFDLHTDEVRAEALWRAFDGPSDAPWYKALYQQKATPSYLSTLQAEGKIASRRIVFPSATATKVSGRLRIESGKLWLTHLTGEILGGQHTGEWTADLSARPPAYSGTGTLEHAALAQLSSAMKDDWVQGMVNGSYRLKASGWKMDELAKSALGEAQWEAQSGLLTHVILSEDEPLRFESFSGKLLLRDGSFQVEESKLQSSDGIYQVSGTASMERVLNLKLIRDGAHGFSVTGPLNDPHVAAAKVPDTQAALKP